MVDDAINIRGLKRVTADRADHVPPPKNALATGKTVTAVGGGQPIHDGQELAFERGKNLYADYLGEPMSHRAHQLLHADHNAWEMPGKPR